MSITVPADAPPALGTGPHPQLPFTLSPLPPVLHDGLIAVAFFAILSFIATLSLFSFITYRIFYVWRKNGHKQNQFILLIYNLVIADLQQSIGFGITLIWRAEDAIRVGSCACWAQGWFIQIGDVASSAWIFAIAVHTLGSVILGLELGFTTFCVCIACIWLFSYGLAIIGVAMHPTNIWARAGAWCWINPQFIHERLYLHYLWIFVFMFGTVAIYALIFFLLHQRIRTNYWASTSTLAIDASRAMRYMVIYPLIYTICTLPLAASRMAGMTGKHINYDVYCVVGAMIASAGWLNCTIYSLTRRGLLLSIDPPRTCGLAQFRWDIASGHGTVTAIEGGRKSSTYNKGGSKQGSQENLVIDMEGMHGVKQETTVEVHSETISTGAASGGVLATSFEEEDAISSKRRNSSTRRNSLGS
ncbi:MAG: hypothetical protein M1834_000380 [Cirrosporium novae-zelandiae]|nr:MAG: hypothetical protein M1834_000380 [Cirrosporium novae-zelandiae]